MGDFARGRWDRLRRHRGNPCWPSLGGYIDFGFAGERGSVGGLGRFILWLGEGEDLIPMDSAGKAEGSGLRPGATRRRSDGSGCRLGAVFGGVALSSKAAASLRTPCDPSRGSHKVHSKGS